MTSGWEVKASCAQSVVVGDQPRFKRLDFCEPNKRPIFFYLRHDSPYTQDLITNCNHRLHCFNCNRSIATQVWFAPIELTKQEEFVVDALPHCRKECALATTLSRTNNADRLACFYMMYGPQVRCAPPREILYVPNGCSMQRYHEMIDENLVMDLHTSSQIRSFVAPMYLSGAIFNDNVISSQALEFSKQLIGEPPGVFTHSTHDSLQGDHPVLTLPMHTDIATVHTMFAVDPMANDFLE